PPRTWQQELRMNDRFAATIRAARELGINRIQPATRQSQGDEYAPIGFITTGMGGPYLQHVLTDLGLSGVFPILNMGMSYPVDTEMVRQFAALCRTMFVIEERRGFLEKNIRDALFHAAPEAEAAQICGRLFGKTFPGGADGIPDTRGLNYSVLAQKLIPL